CAGQEAEDRHRHRSFVCAWRYLIAAAAKFRRHARTVAVLADQSQSARRLVIVPGVAADAGQHRILWPKSETGTVVGRASVATNADIPISGPINAGPGASSDDAAVQASCCGPCARLVQGGMQRHQRLLVVRTASRGATNLKMEGTVLPENVVGKERIRDLFTISIQESPTRVTGGTCHRSWKKRAQLRAVRRCRKASGLGSRSSAGSVGPVNARTGRRGLITSQAGEVSVEERSRP